MIADKTSAEVMQSSVLLIAAPLGFIGSKPTKNLIMNDDETVEIRGLSRDLLHYDIKVAHLLFAAIYTAGLLLMTLCEYKISGFALDTGNVIFDVQGS